MAEKCLPFPRGETFNEGSVLTLDGTEYAHLEGTEYEVPDTQHSTGVKTILRIVRNGSGSAITAENRFLMFDNESKEFGRVVSGFNTVAGGVAVPLDDAYTAGKSIAANDMFYVVRQGWCNVKSEAGLMNLAAHAAIASDASGYVNGAAAVAGETVLGIIDQASTAEATAVRCFIDVSLRPAEAAG